MTSNFLFAENLELHGVNVYYSAQKNTQRASHNSYLLDCGWCGKNSNADEALKHVEVSLSH